MPSARRRASGQVSTEFALVLGIIAFGCIVALPYPTALADCEDDGWKDFPQFADQSACEAYVDGLTP